MVSMRQPDRGDAARLSRDPSTESSVRSPRDRLRGYVLLVWLAVLFSLVLLGLWPVSYDLTQGSDFSYEYLVQYRNVWDWFRPIFEGFEASFPGAAASLVQLTVLLSLFWVATFALYIGAFLLLRTLPQTRLAAALVVVGAMAFQTILFLMPGTFTTDLFSYVMYGYIPRVYELNPYIYVPGYFPANRMTSWIHPVWYYTPSIYGPIWIDFSVWLTGFTKDSSLVDQALAYRLVSNLAHLVNLGLTGLLLRKLAPARPVALLLLFAWNPLLLFEFAASGHNDSFMMMFLLLAALLVAYQRHLLAVVGLALAALVKATPVLLLPLLALHWAGRQRSRAAQLRAVVLTGAIPLMLAVALYWPWYDGPETFQLIEYWSKGPMYLNYVPDLVALTLADQVIDPQQIDQAASWETARTWVKWFTRPIFLAYFSLELWRVWRAARAGRRPAMGATLLAAMVRVFLVFLLLVNTWVLPWYIAWPFMLAVPLGWERLETRLITGFSFSAPIMMYNHHYWSVHMAPWLYLVYLAPLLLLVPWRKLPFGLPADQRRTADGGAELASR
jgi:hypothetical protein